MSVAVLEGILARMLTTGRLTTRVLFSGPDDGIPVLFIHGNFSSATWWEETMLRLPPGYLGIAPDQRGFGDAEPGARVDATRGMRDFVDDAIALMDHLGTWNEGDKRPPLRSGMELLVQVTKEESTIKGAALTSYISIAGRYMVMMLGMKRYSQPPAYLECCIK